MLIHPTVDLLTKLGLGGIEGFWSPWSWLLAIGGSVIVLLIYNAVARRA